MWQYEFYVRRLDATPDTPFTYLGTFNHITDLFARYRAVGLFQQGYQIKYRWTGAEKWLYCPPLFIAD